MSTEFLATRDLIAHLNARFKRLEQQIVDLDSAVRSQPPSLPASASAVSAESLFENAKRDLLAANYDLALRQFSDYMRLFGNTAMAADAQFHVGEIHYRNQDLPTAIQAFDLFLEQHPQSARAPDARYLKAMALERQGERKQASQELSRVIREYPNSDVARLAKDRLRRPTKPATGARP
jgi:tol-pal system protein YbgF